MSQLILLSGKVSNLKTKKGYKSFISSNAGRAATQAGALLVSGFKNIKRARPKKHKQE